MMASGAKTRSQILIVVILGLSLLLGLVLAGSFVPNWRSPSEVPGISVLREIRKTGIELPSERTNQVLPLKIGGHNWVGQDLLPIEGDKPATVLLRPQADPKDKPYVDWSDLNGFFSWQQDPVGILTVNIPDTDANHTITARWFIARDPQDTKVVHHPQRVVVAQWYGFKTGGHYAMRQWFWRDLQAQLKGDRVPWLAVCLRLPIDPNITLDATEDVVTELIQVIQGSIGMMLQSEA
ncbi:MAG: cyanoexosortase B system-associated protein [Spirulina sp. SIO3F2]|nr:cyanoexosortase B system-associated protein [Spirulina sp. SIO3F2]